MTDTTVTTDIHQTLDIQLNFRTQITFYLEVFTNYLTDFSGLFIIPIFNFDVLINTGLFQNEIRTTASYTVLPEMLG